MEGQLAGGQVTADQQVSGAGRRSRSSAQAYHRWPLEPWPAERTSHCRLSFTSCFTACAQVSFVPPASVTGKLEATRST